MKKINKLGWQVVTCYLIATLIGSTITQTIIFEIDNDWIFDTFAGWVVSLIFGLLFVWLTPLKKSIFS